MSGESSISKRARELMEVAARLHGRVYTPPPPRIPRDKIAKRREQDELSSHEVYFLYSCGKIKIGTSKHHVRRVVRDISPYCPAPLRLIGVIPGGPIVEARLHARFRESRAHDEWFYLSEELAAFMREDTDRAESLDGAQDDYQDWLEDELCRQKDLGK